MLISLNNLYQNSKTIKISSQIQYGPYCMAIGRYKTGNQLLLSGVLVPDSHRLYATPCGFRTK